MKAAIMLSNCAAGSSLFSDAPRPHRAPFCLIYCLWEAQCTEKEMLCPRPLQIDVPFSFVFTCLNGWVGFSSAPDWPLLLPVRRETTFLAEFLTDVPFSSVTFFLKDLNMAALQVSSLLLWGCSSYVHERMVSTPLPHRNIILILSFILNVADKSGGLGFNTR